MKDETTKLSQIARISSGGTPRKSHAPYWGGTIPWLSPKEMTDFQGTTEAKVTEEAIGNGTRLSSAPSIFIAVRGMSLHTEIRIVYSNNAIAFNQDVKAIEVLEGDPKYVYYHLLASKPHFLEKVESSGHGTGVLPTEILNTYEIDLPSLPEQIRIAHILGSLDDKIELNRQMNETLEAIAQALFQDWFVDFGPTRAKMEGREPYLAPEIWELFPDRLGEDGVPEGWERKPLNQFATIRGGKQLSRDRFDSNGAYPVFGGAGIMGRTTEYNTEGFSIIVGRVGAYCGQFFQHTGPAWVNNNASLIRCTNPSTQEWVFDSLLHADINAIKKGAAQPFVSNTDVSELQLTLPTNDLAHHYSHQRAKLMVYQYSLVEESKILAQTRDALLADFFR